MIESETFFPLWENCCCEFINHDTLSFFKFQSNSERQDIIKLVQFFNARNVLLFGVSLSFDPYWYNLLRAVSLLGIHQLYQTNAMYSILSHCANFIETKRNPLNISVSLFTYITDKRVWYLYIAHVSSILTGETRITYSAHIFFCIPALFYVIVSVLIFRFFFLSNIVQSCAFLKEMTTIKRLEYKRRLKSTTLSRFFFEQNLHRTFIFLLINKHNFTNIFFIALKW